MVSKYIGKKETKLFPVEAEFSIGNAFSINSQKILGSGAFGVIYSGFNNKTKEEVAIKLESQKTLTPQLIYESKILKILEGGSKHSIFYSINLSNSWYS